MQYRGRVGTQTDDTTSVAFSDGGLRSALLLGIAVWVILLAAVFTSSWYLYARDGANTLLCYFFTLFLPQVISSVGGALTFVTTRRTSRRAGFCGAIFALVTCSIGAFAGVLCLFLLVHDRPTGAKFLGWFALAFLVVAVVDGLVAALGGYLTSRVTRRRVSPTT